MSPELQETCVTLILFATLAFVLWQLSRKLFTKSGKDCHCAKCPAKSVQRPLSRESKNSSH